MAPNNQKMTGNLPWIYKEKNLLIRKIASFPLPSLEAYKASRRNAQLTLTMSLRTSEN